MKIRLSLLMAIMPLLLQAQVRKYSNEFMQIGVGARALGMANSVVALTDDVSSGYWNPAGLTRIEENLQIGLMHNIYYSGIANYDYAAFATPVGKKGAIAVSGVRFGIDNIPNTFDLIQNGQINYDRVKSFSAVDYGFLGSYAHKINEFISVGGNAKVIYRKVGSFANAWGFGIDAGMQYNKKNLFAAAMLRDASQTYNTWKFTFTEAEKLVLFQTGNVIPQSSLEKTNPALIGAVGYNFDLYKDKLKLYLETDWKFTFDGMRNTLIKSDPVSVDPSLGLELSYAKVVYLRAGAGNWQRYTDDDGKKVLGWMPTLGAGFRIKAFTIDYALTDFGNTSLVPLSNVFSLRIAIRKGETGS